MPTEEQIAINKECLELLEQIEGNDRIPLSDWEREFLNSQYGYRELAESQDRECPFKSEKVLNVLRRIAKNADRPSSARRDRYHRS